MEEKPGECGGCGIIKLPGIEKPVYCVRPRGHAGKHRIIVLDEVEDPTGKSLRTMEIEDDAVIGGWKSFTDKSA